VSVDDPPEQIVDGDAVAETLGKELTVTVIEAVFEHPIELVPVTEYVVVDVGLTVMLAVVCPVLHRYEVAPLAVKVVDAPGQITEEGEADIVTLGNRTVNRQELLIMDPQELEIMQRYLLPFMLAEAVILNTEVKTPL